MLHRQLSITSTLLGLCVSLVACSLQSSGIAPQAVPTAGRGPEPVVDASDAAELEAELSQGANATETTPGVETTTTGAPVAATETTAPPALATAETLGAGLALNVARAFAEYTLFNPHNSRTTYLIDMNGNVVHTWENEHPTSNSVYLLENGNLLRTATAGRNAVFDAGGAGGMVQEINWDGEVVWEFVYASDQALLHHDVEKLPNGNVLLIAWEYKTAADAIAAGRNPTLLPDGALWPEHIIEVDAATNKTVWEWHMWDHLVQDYDPTQDNYGIVGERPGLIDVNYSSVQPSADMAHINAIDYNAELDQIILSSHNYSEIWVIDHSTTTEEAAGHTGGRSGRGGDLLYRWGNPQAYDAGAADDQQLYLQHDAQWIEAGLNGAGDILIFNNGSRRARPFSTVDEIAPLPNHNGSYVLAASGAYAPDAPVWRYMATTPTDFYAPDISGAQRLPNGNTLICDGPSGTFFEVTSVGEVVWKYVNPFTGQGPRGGTNAVFRAYRYAPDYPGLSAIAEAKR